MLLKKPRRKIPPPRPSKPIDSLDAPGFGPWTAFLLVNVGEGEDSKKQTEIRLDTDPLLVKQLKNSIDQGDWTIVMELGPFYDLTFAYQVLGQWSDGTRGQGPRIAQGICLWQQYRDQGVQIRILDQPKQRVQDEFRKKRARQPTGRALGNDDTQDYLTVREVLDPDGTRRKRNKHAPASSAAGKSKSLKHTLMAKGEIM